MGETLQPTPLKPERLEEITNVKKTLLDLQKSIAPDQVIAAKERALKDLTDTLKNLIEHTEAQDLKSTFNALVKEIGLDGVAFIIKELRGSDERNALREQMQNLAKETGKEMPVKTEGEQVMGFIDSLTGGIKNDKFQNAANQMITQLVIDLLETLGKSMNIEYAYDIAGELKFLQMQRKHREEPRSADVAENEKHEKEVVELEKPAAKQRYVTHYKKFKQGKNTEPTILTALGKPETAQPVVEAPKAAIAENQKPKREEVKESKELATKKGGEKIKITVDKNVVTLTENDRKTTIKTINTYTISKIEVEEPTTTDADSLIVFTLVKGGEVILNAGSFMGFAKGQPIGAQRKSFKDNTFEFITATV